MKRIFLIAIVTLGASVAVYFLFLKEPTFTVKNEFLNNINDKGVAIEGYDPVAYFTDNKPLKGDENLSVDFNGATYWFASEEHVGLFKHDPKKYAPQYGAFCGYAVSIGNLRPVDPAIYQIENGRLILQQTQEAYELFNEDLKANIQKADENWPGIVAKHAGKFLTYDEKQDQELLIDPFISKTQIEIIFMSISQL